MTLDTFEWWVDRIDAADTLDTLILCERQIARGFGRDPDGEQLLGRIRERRLVLDEGRPPADPQRPYRREPMSHRLFEDYAARIHRTQTRESLERFMLRLRRVWIDDPRWEELRAEGKNR